MFHFCYCSRFFLCAPKRNLQNKNALAALVQDAMWHYQDVIMNCPNQKNDEANFTAMGFKITLMSILRYLR